MAQQQIKGATGTLGSGGALDTYVVPGAVIITPYAVSTIFDGSGASGSFLPCLTFKTQTGAVIARCPAPEVASGDTAEVSWFPHVAQAAATPVGSGIQFDTEPQDGDWLFVETTGSNPDLAQSSIQFTNTGNDGIQLVDKGAGGVSLGATADGGIILNSEGTSHGKLDLESSATDGELIIRNTGSNGLLISDDSSSGISMTQVSDGGITLFDEGTGGIFIAGNSTGGVFLYDNGGGGIFMRGLPNSAPGASNQLWNNGGVLNITP